MLGETNLECVMTGKLWEIEEHMKQVADLNIPATFIHSKFMKYLLDAVRLKSFNITSTITNLYEYVSLLIWSLPSSDHINNTFRQGRDETATKDSDSSFNHRAANRSGEIDAWAAMSKNEERVEFKLLEDEKAVWEVWVIKKKGKSLANFRFWDGSESTKCGNSLRAYRCLASSLV